MKYTARYLIELRAEQRERAASILVASVDVLAQPVLVSRPVGGRTIRGPSDWVREAKLLYIAGLHDEYLLAEPGDVEQRGFQRELQTLLGPPPWDESTFDRWWTIREVEDEGRLEEVEAQASALARERIPSFPWRAG